MYKFYVGCFNLIERICSVYVFKYTMKNGEICAEVPIRVSHSYSTEYIQDYMNKVLSDFYDEDTFMMISLDKKKVEDWLDGIQQTYINKFQSYLTFLKKPIRYVEHEE